MAAGHDDKEDAEEDGCSDGGHVFPEVIAMLVRFQDCHAWLRSLGQAAGGKN
jgi:hypothetical protein